MFLSIKQKAVYYIVDVKNGNKCNYIFLNQKVALYLLVRPQITALNIFSPQIYLADTWYVM